MTPPFPRTIDCPVRSQSAPISPSRRPLTDSRTTAAGCRWKKRINRGVPSAVRAVSRPRRLGSLASDGQPFPRFSRGRPYLSTPHHPRERSPHRARYPIRMGHPARLNSHLADAQASLIVRAEISGHAREMDLFAVRTGRLSLATIRESLPEARGRRVHRRKPNLPDSRCGEDLALVVQTPVKVHQGGGPRSSTISRVRPRGSSIAKSAEHDRHRAGDCVPQAAVPSCSSTAGHNLWGGGRPHESTAARAFVGARASRRIGIRVTASSSAPTKGSGGIRASTSS